MMDITWVVVEGGSWRDSQKTVWTFFSSFFSPQLNVQFTEGVLSFFLSLYTATPPREDYVQVDCVLKPRYKKCSEKELNKR